MTKKNNPKTNRDAGVIALQKQIHMHNKSALSDKKSQLNLADTYKSLASVYFRQSNYEDAKDLFSKALFIYNKFNNYHGYLACRNAHASICLAKGELPTAKSELENLLKKLKGRPNTDYEHIVLNNLGIVYDKSGDLAQAVLYFHRSLAMKKEMPEPILPTYTLHNLAHIHFQVEDYETALKYNYMALDTIKNSDDLIAKSSIYNGIGQSLSKKGQLNEARHFFLEARKLATKTNSSTQIAEALAGLGHLDFKKGDFSSAEKLLNQSLNTSQNISE